MALQTLEKFYEAFSNCDARRMADCYHENASFLDPAFGRLNKEEVCAMWSMLLSSKTAELEVVYFDLISNGKEGSARWEAKYYFGKQRRLVFNSVASTFVFEGDKILKHLDEFDMWRWTRQALGISGILLGWTPYMQNKIQKTTKARLANYIASTTN